MRKFVLWALPALFALVACQSEKLESTQGVPVTFSQFAASVRVSGANWSSNDSIGVNMFASSTSSLLGTNTAYYTPQGNGSFSAAPTPLYYPSDGSSVNFTAYYPYSARVTGTTYALDFTSANATADFLYSSNIQGWSSTVHSGALSFKRPLAAVVFNITTDSAVVDGSKLKATLSGLPAQGTFDLSTGTLTVDASSVVDYSAVASGTGKSFTITLPAFPATPVSGVKVTFTSPSGKTLTKSLDIASLTAGNSIYFTTALSNMGLSDTTGTTEPEQPGNYLSFSETPVISEAQLAANKYVVHYMPDDPSRRNYSMLYSPEYKISYWVAYPMYAGVTGSVSRTDAWQADPQVADSDQADLSSGFKTSGYDRGHQMASADRNATAAQNRTTFYYTNMTPQTSKLNQGVWATLENDVRGWMSGTDTLFVVTGAMPTSATDQTLQYALDRRSNKVVIPKYYFKALARKIGGQFYTIAFKFDNVVPTNNDPMSYAISVADLEKMTGFTFFPSLTAADKATLDLSKWQ